MLYDRRHTLRLHTTHVGCCHGSTEGGLLTTDVLGGASVEGDACEVDTRAEDHVGTLGAELSPERSAIAVGEGYIPGCADGELRQAHGAADIKAGGAGRPRLRVPMGGTRRERGASGAPRGACVRQPARTKHGHDVTVPTMRRSVVRNPWGPSCMLIDGMRSRGTAGTEPT